MQMALKIPDKKIILVSIGAVIAIVGAVFLKYKPFNYNMLLAWQKTKPKTDTVALVQNEIEKDTDEDGLKDWEEKLWKTDPAKADTDGDGTPDGEEVRDGRDPALAGPSDTLDKQDAIKRILENSGDTSSNSTDAFAREFFSQYLDSSGKIGGALGTADKEKLIVNLTAGEGAKPLVYKHWSFSDLQVLPDGSQEAIRAYGNSLGQIISQDSVTDFDNELGTLTDALQKQDSAILEKLNPIISHYNKIITSSATVPVPPSARTLHVNFLNSLQELSESIFAMKSVFTDPLLALKSLQNYAEAKDALTKSLTDLGSYFEKNGIVWQKAEYGTLFQIEK